MMFINFTLYFYVTFLYDFGLTITAKQYVAEGENFITSYM